MNENTSLHKALHLLTRPLTLLAIGVFLLCTGCVPDVEKGVDCIVLTDAGILAFVNGSSNSGKISKDGGYTWRDYHSNQYQKQRICSQVNDYNYFDENNLLVGYLFEEDGTILRREEGNEDWTLEYQTEELSKVKNDIYAEYFDGHFSYPYKPAGLVFDPESENVIFAMNVHGILINESDGDWVEVPYEHYQPIKLNFFEILILFSGSYIPIIIGSLYFVLFRLLLARKKKKLFLSTLLAFNPIPLGVLIFAFYLIGSMQDIRWLTRIIDSTFFSLFIIIGLINFGMLIFHFVRTYHNQKTWIIKTELMSIIILFLPFITTALYLGAPLSNKIILAFIIYLILEIILVIKSPKPIPVETDAIQHPPTP